MANTRLIRIPHNGPIFPKGSVSGPINTPYRESVDVIGQLVMQNYPVVAVLEDGGELELTIHNFDKLKEGAPVQVEKQQEPVKPVETNNTVKVNQPQQNGNQQLSKKERRRLEEAKRAQEQNEKKDIVPDDIDEK